MYSVYHVHYNISCGITLAHVRSDNYGSILSYIWFHISIQYSIPDRHFVIHSVTIQIKLIV